MGKGDKAKWPNNRRISTFIFPNPPVLESNNHKHGSAVISNKAIGNNVTEMKVWD